MRVNLLNSLSTCLGVGGWVSVWGWVGEQTIVKSLVCPPWKAARISLALLWEAWLLFFNGGNVGTETEAWCTSHLWQLRY